jgi:hypothetical protein
MLPSVSLTLLHHTVQDRPAHTSNSDKKSMQDWLTGREILFSANIFKTDPYELIKLKTPHLKCYKCDNFLAKDGHFVSRLPLCHPELRLNGNIGGHVKQWVASHNVTFKSDNSCCTSCLQWHEKEWASGYCRVQRADAILWKGRQIRILHFSSNTEESKIPLSLIFVYCRLTATKWRWEMNEKWEQSHYIIFLRVCRYTILQKFSLLTFSWQCLTYF